MADRDFEHAGHFTQKLGEVVAVQVVAGVDAQAAQGRGLGRLDKGLQSFFFVQPGPGARVGFGVKLHTVCAQFHHSGHGLGHRVHEQAHAHTERVAFVNDGAQARGVGWE